MYQVWNNFKTALLMASLMGLCLGVGYLIGGPRALVPALVIGGIMNVIAFFFSDKIALATVGAVEVSKDDDPTLWKTVRNLAEQAHMAYYRNYDSYDRKNRNI